MSLWNPLNVFSTPDSDATRVEPTGSFDPSRTGDPTGPGFSRPEVGYGRTSVSSPASTGDPARRPIGFAPPEADLAEPRYRTEISFKRHHEVPRASAAPEGADETQPTWATPSLGDDDAANDVVVHVDDEPEAVEKVSFLKREISFRRKKTDGASESGGDDLDTDPVVVDAPAETAEVAAALEPEVDPEPVSRVEDEVEVENADVAETEAADVVPVEAHAEAEADVEPQDVEPQDVEPRGVDDEVLAAAVASELPEEKVSFLKREISFRRRKPEVDAALDAEVEPVPVSRVEDEDVAEKEASDVVPVEAHAEADADVELQDVELQDVEPKNVELENVELQDVEQTDVELQDIEPTDVDEALAAAVVTELPEEKVPFFKREISFRRRPTPDVADGASDDDHAAEVIEEDVSDHLPATVVAAAAAVDLVAAADDTAGHSPELGSDEPVDVVEAMAAQPELAVQVDEDLAAHDEELQAPVDEHVAADEPAGIHEQSDLDIEPRAEVAEDQDAGAGVPAAVASEPQADAADDLPAESGGTDGDLFAEDAEPESKSRFSRKGKGAPKAPKRKPARGGKSGKSRRVVGLKIGASQLAAAVVTEGDAGPELLDLARRPLAAGIVVDGEIRDVDALASAVKAFFDEENLPKKDVRIGLASNRIGVRTFDIVGIDDESRFDNAVRFKAHEVLPVAAHESVLDYRVLEERPNEAGEPSRRVLLVVAPRDQVEPYVEVAKRAGIKLAGIDLEALGLLRTFVDPKPFAAREIDDTATVIVSMGHESSTLLVAGGGACEFTRVFDWGGGSLEEAIATALEVHPAEASTILRHLSLSGTGRKLDSLDEADRAKALDAVRLRLTPFARELVSSLRFYQTQEDSLGIGNIVITGGTSQLEGLAETLFQMIGVNVTVGDPLARVTTTGEFTPAIEAALGSLAVPIGLAMDDLLMRSVDLLPKDAVESKSRRASLAPFAAPIAVAVPLVALGFLYIGAHGKVADKSSELESVKAEIAALPKPQGPKIDAGLVGDEAARATAVASVLGGRLAWDGVFGDLARVMPDNVWLKSLSASLPETDAAGSAAVAAATPPGTATPAPTAVVIEGYTYTQPDVARLLARLATLPSLAHVTLTSSQAELLAKKNVVHFVVVADLSQTGGAS